MFWAGVSEFMTLINDHGQILLTEQSRGEILSKTAEFVERLPGKFVLQFFGGGRIKKIKVSSQCLTR